MTTALQTTFFDYGELDTETRIVVQQRTSEIKALMKRAASDIIEIGQKLIEVKARLGHGNWESWLACEFDWTDQTARRFMQVAKAFGNEKQQIVAFAPSALYLLAAPSTPESARIEAIARAEEGETITHGLARGIIHDHKEPALPFVPDEEYDDDEPLSPYEEQIAARYAPAPIEYIPAPAEPQPANHQLINQSTNNEWYTPRPFLDAAHEVMGGIDLDPASNPLANEAVRAARYYTIDDDGYAQPWLGRVWLNPPYGTHEGESNQARWSRRLIDAYRAGNVSEAILLVNAVPGNAWFAPLKDFPICFPDGRIRFYNADTEAGQPTHSNALIYLGPNVARFVKVFSRFGAVMARLVEYDGQVFIYGVEASE